MNKKIDTASAELHMGILQNRLQKIKGQMNVCAQKINMAENKENKIQGIDAETENLKFQSLDQQYADIEKQLTAYEDHVLVLTAL